MFLIRFDNLLPFDRIPLVLKIYKICAGIAQLVEHCTENAGVPSSSLGPGTVFCGRSSVVERLLAKEKATSSNLVARLNSDRFNLSVFVYGDVAKW